mmetsp:Transcript_22925/g.42557  ORF Transcript_22925/g.42557 Transcript_22925/m.42557 type:complete len:145 (-) Transcript_22925:293-727(-)
MLSLVARRVASIAPRVARAPASTFRAFASKPVPEDEGHIPTDAEQATGVDRSEEVFTTVFGDEFFDRDAISGLEEGTKENPIMVYSAEPERYVGISLEEDSTIRWFCLKEGELAHDPITMNYFALRVISQEQINEALAEAEANL